MSKINQKVILSLALGFVVIWFGINEIMHPASWTAFAPSFLGEGSLVYNLVIIHGFVLIISGISLILGFNRRFFALILSLMLLDIIITLIYNSGLEEIAVRDIGLFGMAIALMMKD
jgi:uncharacterized membrane protein YphA (DoxX/SURF4 family)